MVFWIIILVIMVLAALAERSSKVNAKKRVHDWIQSVVNAPTDKPKLHLIPTRDDYKYGEERALNNALRRYLLLDNERIALKSAIEHLERAQETVNSYGYSIGPEKLSELQEKKQRFNMLNRDIAALTLPFIAAIEFGKIGDVKDCFMQLKPERVTKTNGTTEQNLLLMKLCVRFEGYVVPLSDNNHLIFTPCYLLHFNDQSKFFQIWRYNETKVTIHSEIQTEWSDYGYFKGDIVGRKRWLHETTAGEPDKRHSHNRCYAEVSRGIIRIEVPEGKSEIHFESKSYSTLYYEKLVKMINLHKVSYSRIVRELLGAPDHSKLLDYADTAALINKGLERKQKVELLEKQKEEKEAQKAVEESKRRQLEARTKAEQKRNQKAEEIRRAVEHTMHISNGELMEWRGDPKKAIIPKGYVHTIGTAFIKARHTLETVTISDGVLNIKAEAFKDCISLISIKLPNTVTTIGEAAFFGNKRLPAIILPSGLKEISPYQFQACQSLQSIQIPLQVKRIGERAFAGCQSIRSITLVRQLEDIGNAAFSGCVNLDFITLPARIKRIEDFAFDGCSSLESIELPSTLQYIGKGAFRNCKKLQQCSLPNSTTMC